MLKNKSTQGEEIELQVAAVLTRMKGKSSAPQTAAATILEVEEEGFNEPEEANLKKTDTTRRRSGNSALQIDFLLNPTSSGVVEGKGEKVVMIANNEKNTNNKNKLKKPHKHKRPDGEEAEEEKQRTKRTKPNTQKTITVISLTNDEDVGENEEESKKRVNQNELRRAIKRRQQKNNLSACYHEEGTRSNSLLSHLRLQREFSRNPTANSNNGGGLRQCLNKKFKQRLEEKHQRQHMEQCAKREAAVMGRPQLPSQQPLPQSQSQLPSGPRPLFSPPLPAMLPTGTCEQFLKHQQQYWRLPQQQSRTCSGRDALAQSCPDPEPLRQHLLVLTSHYPTYHSSATPTTLPALLQPVHYHHVEEAQCRPTSFVPFPAVPSTHMLGAFPCGSSFRP